MKTALQELKERIEAISSGGDEMIKTKDLIDAINIYLMIENTYIENVIKERMNIT